MRLQGKRIAALIGPGFEDLEFWVPVMCLRAEGATVIPVGPKSGETYTGKHCLEARSELSIELAKSQEFDAVVIPGGWAPDKLRRYESVKKFVKEMYDAGKVVGMICHAGLVGISAGIVKGHRATGSLGIKDDLENAGAVWVDEPAFRDGNLVWGRVVADIPAYCRELVKAIGES